ncbi:hypothetical protein ACNKHT_01130 [Shigella flexneri]
MVVGDDIAFIGINDDAGTQRNEFLLLAAAITAWPPWQNGELSGTENLPRTTENHHRRTAGNYAAYAVY